MLKGIHELLLNFISIALVTRHSEMDNAE